MFGFVFGLACLGGLYWYLTREEGPALGRRRRPWFRRHLLRRLYDRLDATPAQEQVLEAAVRDLEEEGRNLRREVAATREDVARAMRSEQFDREALQQVVARQDAALSGLRNRVLDALAQVHGSLDSFQRARLSDMILQGRGHCMRRHGLRRFV